MVDATLTPHGSIEAAGAPRGGDETRARAPGAEASFAELYDAHVAFVHRGALRLGVHEAAVEDVVQEVFLVAFRRSSEFRRESSVRTWLYGILLRVARLHRRTAVRAGLHGVIDPSGGGEAERVPDAPARMPDAVVETVDAWRRLQHVLDQLDDDKREIFVLAELEQVPVPEIAAMLGIKLNTAYSRLRLARAAFEDAVSRATRSR